MHIFIRYLISLGHIDYIIFLLISDNSYAKWFCIGLIILAFKDHCLEQWMSIYTIVFCSWVGLVSKNYEIERACMELEGETQDLEHQRKKIKKE